MTRAIHPLCARLALGALLVALLLTLTHADHQAPSRALLALHRDMDGDLVASRNVSITYHVHNVGLSLAQQVALKDLSFPASRFHTFGAVARGAWSSIAPGESQTHQLIVAPLRAGELFVSPASVSYTDDGKQRVTKLAVDDSLRVEDLLSYKRRTDKHTMELSLYALAFFLFCVAPYCFSIFLQRVVHRSTTKKKN
ncbi:unnamed protein product [Agarophyton chilense]